jgi:hypothetical protein
VAIVFSISIIVYGAPGQFIEGNFSGQFREIANNNLLSVACTFRVRKQ